MEALGLSAAALAVVLSACAAPRERVLVAEADAESVSLRAHSTWEHEMHAFAARHCAQSGKTAALQQYRRETSSGDWIYATFLCRQRGRDRAAVRPP